MKKSFSVKNNFNQRIDKFLKEEIFLNMETTRGDIIRSIKAGEILVNNQEIKPSYILKENDRVTMAIKKENSGLTANEKIKTDTIFQNENFLVLNKAAGLQVHPSAKGEKSTLVNGLLAKFPEIKKVGDDPQNRPGIVHRLDSETSGLILVAKNQKTFAELKKLFQTRKIKKTYWAVVYGILENKQGVINAPLARSADYRKQILANHKTKTKIRSAVTKYKVLKEEKNYSLLEVKPRTGRMHQIRVHLFSLGHPVVGDKKYFLRKFSDSKKEILNRHLLHAKEISFSLFNENFHFTSDTPSEFNTFVDLS